MHAKVVTFLTQPGKQDEAVRLFQEIVVPEAEKQKGFRGGILLTDRKNNRNISIGLWETEADIKASEESGFYQEWISRFSEVFSMTPSREIFEVSNLAHVSVSKPMLV